MRGLKIHIIIIAFATTVALAVGGNYLSYKHRIVKPLVTQILAISGVEHAKVVEGSARQRDIIITLQPSVDRAIPAFRTTEQLARKNLGSTLGSVIVNDDRDKNLEAVFYKMHFHLQQAIATGMFTQMEKSINNIAQQEELQNHQVIVEQERVLICLGKNNHMLFAVIPRFISNVNQQPVERRAISLW